MCHYRDLPGFGRFALPDPEIDCRKPFAYTIRGFISTFRNAWSGAGITTNMPLKTGLRCTCGMVARSAESAGRARASRTAMTGGERPLAPGGVGRGEAGIP